jgi:hypothetical protein
VNTTLPSPFEPSPAYSATPATRSSRSDSRPMRGPALRQEAVDLGLAPPLKGVGLAAATAGDPGDGLERDVADPHRHARLGDAEAGGDLGQGQPGAAQQARLLPFGEVAPVSHGAHPPPAL